MAGYNFKDPKEVQEYLKNLYTEYQFGCLSEKNPEVCHLLGDYEEAIKKDYEKSGEIYKKNCDERNFPRSCRRTGEYLYIGRACEKNFTEAFKYMKKSCDLGDERGCFVTGTFMITTGEEVLKEPRDVQIANGIQMLRKACDNNMDKACYFLSGIFLQGIEGYVEKDMKEAYVLSLKSCEAGNPHACSNLSIMHKKGDGVQQSDELAKAFRSRAQDLLNQIKQTKRQLKFQLGIDT